MDYLFWSSIFIIPSGLSIGLQNYCRNDNAPGLVSMVVIITTICNIFGDWLLIFPFQMGTKGAAIATGISQTIGLLILLTRFARRQGNLRFGRTKLNSRIFRDIVVHGLPEGISQLSNPVMTLCMNFVLIQRIGDLGVNAFSVISYIASFSMTAFLGASEGLQPLFGRSYGAKNEADLKYCLKTGLTISAVGSVLITGLSILLGKPICVLFGTDAATTEYIIKYLPPVCRWIYYHGSQCYDLGLLVFHGTFRFVHRHQYSAEPCDQFCCDLDSAPYFWRRGNLVLAAGL